MRRKLLSTLLVTVGTACDGGGDGEANLADRVDAPTSGPLALSDLPADGRDLVVHAQTRTVDPDGTLLAFEDSGGLTREIADRVARPWLYRAEEVVFADDQWSIHQADGTATHTTRVVARANLERWEPPQTTGPPEISDRLRAKLEEAPADEVLTLVLELRNYPEWDIPLRATTAPSSPEEDEAAETRRKGAVEARRALYRQMAAPVRTQVLELGGEVRGDGWGGGWMIAKLRAETVSALEGRSDLRIINLTEGTVTAGWHVGEGRTASRTDADRFIDAGYDGDQPQPPTGGRHGYTTIAIGIIEPEIYEDEACYFDDGSGCNGSYNLAGRYQCNDADSDGNDCESVANFADNENPWPNDNARHGTAVTSIAIANYRQGQVGSEDVGGTNPDWENEATGYAPEARVVLFGDMVGDESFADAYDDAIDLGLDITNSSWGSPSDCNSLVDRPFEYEVENAFDDGILNVTITHNGAVTNESDPCTVTSPGNLHKALTVASYRTGTYPEVTCPDDYRTCDLGTGRVGGATVYLPLGGSALRAASLVDLVAPGDSIQSLTSHEGDHGTLVGGSGTSYAAPAVAGMAALLKDMYLFQAQTWINNPGRLHTAMLAMGDRHRSGSKSSTSQALSGTSRIWGLGRTKMRMFASGGGLGATYVATGTRALTSTSPDERFMLWSAPMPAGTDLLKCVLFQREDMSHGKTIVSNVNIGIRARLPTGGSCVANSGSFGAFETWDEGADVKSMAALESSSLAGKCAELDILNANVSATYGVTAWYFCYTAEVSDDEPN